MSIFYQENRGKGVTAALIFNYAAGSNGEMTDASKKAADGKKKKKTKKPKSGAAGTASTSLTTAAAGGSPPPSSSSPSAGGGNQNTKSLPARYCYGYNSSAGCDRSSAQCRFEHANPPKDSEGAQALVKYFKENSTVVASKNFSKYSV